MFGPTLGNALSNLKAAGYSPEQADHIVITHMHPDQVRGLMSEGKPAFPNASLHIDQKDVDYWLSKANMDAAPEDRKCKKLVLWGDLMHLGAVQFNNPALSACARSRV